MAWMEQLESVPWARAIACGVGAYLLGCFTTGFYLVRARTRRDLRQIESGTTGARNAGRVLGAIGFYLTVLGDFAKGVLAVWAAAVVCRNEVATGLALLAVVAGHIWPVQLRFQGGKGVVVSLAGLLVLDWRVAVAYAVIFFLLYLVMHRTVLPGLGAYFCLPFVDYGLDRDPLKTLWVALTSLLVLLAHRNNLLAEIPALGARRSATVNPEKPKP